MVKLRGYITRERVSMNKTGKLGITPIILMSPLIILYFLEMFGLVYLELVYAGLIMFFGFIYYSMNRTLENTMTKASLYTIIYFLLLICAVSLSNMFAVNPTYSLLRGTYSIGLYLFMFFIYKAVNENYLSKVNWRLFLSRFFFITLLIILIGQITIPEWRAGVGGVRLSGGTNANFVSFFALFVIFTSHLNALLDGGKWTKLNRINWLLGLVSLLWSMSRSAILGFVVFYTIYIGWYFVKGYLTAFLRGELPKKLVKNTLKAIVAILTLVLFVKYILPQNVYEQVMMRLTGEEGFTTRALAWDILLSHFQDNPLFGGIGWFYSPNVLPGASGVADSAHNSYIRILSEVGLVGFIPIMILPVVVMIWLFIKSYKAYRQKETNKERVFLIVNAYLISLFCIIFFENHFLSGLFRLSNLVIILVISLGYVLCVKKNIININTDTVKKKTKRKRYKIVWSK